ncbi:MAG: 5-methylcytosine-specific restriction enzyme [Thermomicrobiales bacterium]|jgi:5-methylcytosine-specific restriction protein A|nr:5-methylcytosine-specific restriction enzyme [Thermomicrobiales bacterium]
MAGNPSLVWERDELILALDLYFKHRPHIPVPPSHPNVEELSELLNSLPLHPSDDRVAEFRNPNGVSMKTANFKAIDPEMTGVALSRVGQRDREVWAEFAGDHSRLHDLALAIRRNVKAPEIEVSASEDEDEVGAAEGRILMRIHKARERKPGIVRRKKDRVLKATGKLVCEACDFDFSQTYGELGYGFIECHHTVPVSELEPDKPTKIGDLALLCANCHRMIHRSRPMKTVPELTDLIRSVM